MSMKKKTVEETDKVITIEEADLHDITATVEEVVPVANTDKVNAANTLIAQTFNIDNTYYVTGVADKGNSMVLSFANPDYEVTVKIKDAERAGILSL